MKYRWDKKYLYWGMTAFLVIVAAILFYLSLSQFSVLKAGALKLAQLLSPVTFGLVIAYLLARPLNWVEKRWFLPFFERRAPVRGKGGKKVRAKARMLSVTTVVGLTLLALAGLIWMILPQLIASFENLARNMEGYVNSFLGWVDSLLFDNTELEESLASLLSSVTDRLVGWINTDLLPSVNEVVGGLSSAIATVAQAIFDFFIGMVVSIYVLYNKETMIAQAKKLAYCVCSRKTANSLISGAAYTNRVFGGYLSGKLTECLLITLLCFLFMSLFRMPYSVLISIIIGVTDMIPSFGPFIGAVPSAFLILLVDPLQCLIFVIFIVVLQAVEGNIIGPRILGESTGLAGFWVVFSILLFGGLFGFLGLLVGVPIFALIYHWISRKAATVLKRKNLPTRTEDYRDLLSIDSESGEPVYSKRKARRTVSAAESTAEPKASESSGEPSLLQRLGRRLGELLSRFWNWLLTKTGVIISRHKKKARRRAQRSELRRRAQEKAADRTRQDRR